MMSLTFHSIYIYKIRIMWKFKSLLQQFQFDGFMSTWILEILYHESRFPSRSLILIWSWILLLQNAETLSPVQRKLVGPERGRPVRTTRTKATFYWGLTTTVGTMGGTTGVRRRIEEYKGLFWQSQPQPKKPQNRPSGHSFLPRTVVRVTLSNLQTQEQSMKHIKELLGLGHPTIDAIFISSSFCLSYYELFPLFPS